MTAGFEKTNWGWEFYQQRTKFFEWVELQISRFRLPDLDFEPNLPDWPQWLVDALSSLFKILAWTLLVLVVTWSIWQLLLILIPRLRDLRQSFQRISRPATTTPVKPSAWWQRAREWKNKGNYQEAARALYMGMLQILNDVGIAPHKPSRTDGEYRQITSDRSQCQPCNTLLYTHEDAYFGGIEVSAERLDLCQDAYKQIEMLQGQISRQKSK